MKSENLNYNSQIFTLTLNSLFLHSTSSSIKRLLRATAVLFLSDQIHSVGLLLLLLLLGLLLLLLLLGLLLLLLLLGLLLLDSPLSSSEFYFFVFAWLTLCPSALCVFWWLCWLYFSICELWLTGFYWTSVFTVLSCRVMSCVDRRLSWCLLWLWIETWVLTIDYCVKCK